MGGYGSTRWGWHDTANTADGSKRLSIADLMRASLGAIKTERGYAGRIFWTCRGQPAGDVMFFLVYRGVRFVYTEVGSGVEYDYKVDFETQARHFGGQQWYFRCPECDARASKLYLPPGASRFACRRCHRLTYASCQESRKYDALARMIGVTPDDMRRLNRMMKQRLK